jgi:hypothetical protein
MTDDNLPPFSFPAVSRKQVTAAFDGGRLTSDGGVMLLAMADRRLGIALGLDIRFVVTNIAHSPAEWIYDSLYCALLRARADGEPDQVAQNATGLGSNILPFRHRQPYADRVFGEGI